MCNRRDYVRNLGPDGIYVAALGNRGAWGRAGYSFMDAEAFDVRGQ